MRRSDLHTKKGRKKVYIGFVDQEKAYDRVNRETLCQVLRMYDVVDNVEWYREYVA